MRLNTGLVGDRLLRIVVELVRLYNYLPPFLSFPD